MFSHLAFTTNEMEIAAEKSVKRLKELSEAGEYTREYYSMHRSLKNLEKRGIRLDLSSLSEEERAYLTGECLNMDLEVLRGFKSTMRFYYTKQYWFDKKGEVSGGYELSSKGGQILQIYNPGCFLKVHNSDSIWLNYYMTLEESYMLRNTECPEILHLLINLYHNHCSVKDLLRQYIYVTEKEFGFYPDNKSFITPLFEPYTKIRDLEKENEKLQSHLFHLKNHPPQQIECTECGHEIEVCYDSTTEELKEHFKLVEELRHS